MSDEIKHECAVAMVVLRRPPSATRRGAHRFGDFGVTKLSLLMEKQHNRGQDGAGAAIISANPAPGAPPYQIFKSASATSLADVLGMIGKRKQDGTSDAGPQASATEVRQLTSEVERIFLGHLRYATFGKNEVAYCHPFVHEASDLKHTLLLAGNFNLTNAAELFDEYSHHGAFPTSRADGYLICELISKELRRGKRSVRPCSGAMRGSAGQLQTSRLAQALSAALAGADGAWTLIGATGAGEAFALRDPHGIRPGFYYIDDEVVVVASERPAIQAAFDIPPEAVKELPPGEALIVSPRGKVVFEDLNRLGHAKCAESDVSDLHSPTRSAWRDDPLSRPCAFERIYFSRANDADIHRERKALGAALLPQILKAAGAALPDIFFSYIPNSARIAFHGLIERLFEDVFSRKEDRDDLANFSPNADRTIPRFGEIAVKDAKFRTFIADAAARREFYKHVYDVTYGLVRPGKDTLVVLDDSIVRGNTMKNAILPMLDRLGPKRIVVASSAPPIRYPDCYGIDMSTLGELVAFKALVNLLDGERGTGNGERELRKALEGARLSRPDDCGRDRRIPPNPLAALYARFTEAEHAAEIARLLTPPAMKAEVVVVYQTVDALRQCLTPTATRNYRIGDWYFTGDYPTPGGYKVLHKALLNYLEHKTDRSY